jgi:hypothetical protein
MKMTIKMTKKEKMIWAIIIGLLAVLITLKVALATDCTATSGCSLHGNYYLCTGTFTTCSNFTGNAYSIYLRDANITYTGSAGGTSANGGSGLVSITSLSRIRIENLLVSSTGGAGGAGNAASGSPAGGTGGDSGLQIEAGVETRISNLTVVATSGIGGAGSASNDYNYGHAGGGGNTLFTLDSPTIVWNNSVSTMTSGAGGLAAADAYCTGAGCSDSAYGTGGTAGFVNITVISSHSTLYGVNFTTTGNNGGGGAGDVVGSDESVCGWGGQGGGSFGTISLGNTTGQSLRVVSDSGRPGQPGCDCSSDSDESYNGMDGPNNNFTIDLTNSSTFDDLVLDLKGGTGADGTGCDAGTGRMSADGGMGGYNYVTFISSGTRISSVNLTLDGGIPGTNAYSGSGASCQQAGIGGSNYLYLNNIYLMNSTGKISATNGATASAEGSGGHGGDDYIYFTNSSTIDSTIWDIVAGNGTNTNTGINLCSVGTTRSPGRGGHVFIYGPNSTFNVYNLTLRAIAGEAGSGSYQGPSTGFGIGGVSFIDLPSTTIINRSSLFLDGGLATNTKGGDAYINSSTSLTIKNSQLLFTPGAYASLNGSCDNRFNSYFSIEGSLLQCNGTGTATIVGTGMSQVDYRNQTIIDLNGLTNNVTWNFSGSTQKFLIWNTSFEPTGINWDCATARFANRTPTSVGSVNFNCTTYTNDTFDQYYTTVNSLSQIWNSSGTIKTRPYSYPEYYCQINASFPGDLVGTLQANFSWLKNGTVQPAFNETGVTLVSGVPYLSTAIVNHTSISLGDNWTCVATLYSDFAQNFTNSSLVVPAYPDNLKVDIGADGTDEYTYSGQFSGSAEFNLSSSSINQYLKDCDNSTCYVPVKIYSDENSTILINKMNTSYGVASPIDGLFNLTLSLFSTKAGTVNVFPISFEYPYGDNNTIRITAHDSIDTSSVTYYITVIQSLFNYSMPANVDYFEVYPRTLTSKNVSPVGQTASVPILNITNLHASRNEDIYIKLNESWVSQGLPCMEMLFNTNSTPIGHNISTSSYLYCANVTPGGNCYLWAYHNFNCTSSQVANSWYDPVFVYDSICSDCVITSDAFTD